MPDELRPWARLLAGTCAAISCLMALAIVTDALVLTEAEHNCLKLTDRQAAAGCLATADRARETQSVPGAILLAILSGAVSVLTIEDARRHLP